MKCKQMDRIRVEHKEECEYCGNATRVHCAVCHIAVCENCETKHYNHTPECFEWPKSN